MTYLNIIDTGYVVNKELSTLTQDSNANRAGELTAGGVASFNLEVKSITFGSSVNTQEEANIEQTQNHKINILGAKNPKLTISFIIDRTRTDLYKNKMLHQLRRLELTNGLKILTTPNDQGMNLIKEFGDVNIGGFFGDTTPTDQEGTVLNTLPYLLGKFSNFNIGDTNKDHYTGSVTFTIEK